MFILVIGGAASGKSEYAENMCMQLAKQESRLYIATMEPYGEEAKNRIERHHKLRKNKGFDTLEKYRNLWEIEEVEAHTILLECMSTLLCNEYFMEEHSEEISLDSILKGIKNLTQRSQNLVVVSNKICSDGIAYDKDTMDYIRALGALNRSLANIADIVVEVVCGIPVYIKGSNDVERRI